MPGTPETRIARAAVHYGAGEYDAAARCALDIVAQSPEHFDALHLLGVLCLDRGLPADAANYLERAARLQPNNPLLNLNRGNAWLALKLFSRATAASRHILALDPGHVAARNNLGIALGNQEQPEEAIEAYRIALTHQPDYAPAHFNMAKSLMVLGRLGEAEASYRAALRHLPPTAPRNRISDIVSDLGRVLTEQDRPQEALALFLGEQTRLGEPLDLGWYESLLYLQLGDYEAGWRGYESRWQVAAHDKPRADATVPDIAAVAGKRILLLPEQGRGDIVQFARYAPLLAERGAIVHLSVYDDLKPLLSSLPGVAGIYGEDELEPAYDIVTPLLSLPLAFGTTIATIPVKVPYLQADPARVALWRARLDGEPRPRIGLTWSSTNPGAGRMTRLEVLRPLLDHPNASFHALQKEISDVDLDFMRVDGRVLDHRLELTDFAETAALIEALDLVITIDTAVAHVAGALGKPVWIMLPHVAEWRWLRHRTDSPWYPTARLFRQPAPGDWGGLVGRIAAALGD